MTLWTIYNKKRVRNPGENQKAVFRFSGEPTPKILTPILATTICHSSIRRSWKSVTRKGLREWGTESIRKLVLGCFILRIRTKCPGICSLLWFWWFLVLLLLIISRLPQITVQNLWAGPSSTILLIYSSRLIYLSFSTHAFTMMSSRLLKIGGS